MLDRMPQTDAHGNIEIRILFYEAEAFLYRHGETAGFLTMLANTAASKLYDRGGLRPFVFSCIGGDGNISPHIFVAQERT